MKISSQVNAQNACVCLSPVGQTVTSHPDERRPQASLPGHADRGGRQRQQPGVGDAG